MVLSPVEQSIREKIEKAGKPLKDWDIRINYGIKTGCNEAFIISTERREEILADCGDEAERSRTAALIRPILRGRDIKRYSCEWAGLWLINTHNGIKGRLPRIRIEDYPAVKAHLDQYWPLISKRADRGDTPYNLRNCAYLEDLFKQKIIWGEISDKPKFTIDLEGGYCPEATTFLMTGQNLKYLLCFLNSTFSEYFFAKYGTTTGMGTLRWKKYLIELLPVPQVDETKQADLERLLDNLLIDKSNRNTYIKAIDAKIYEYLNLSIDEIRFIEAIVKKGAH